MLTGRICLAVTVVACLTAPPAPAATRPGSVERGFGGFGSDRVLSVDTVGSDRIVAAGQTFGYPRHHGWVRAWLPDGRLDPAFGANDGQVDFGESNGVIRALALDDGRIVVVHTRPDPTEPGSPLITRLNRDGTLDQSFGSAGSIEPDYAGSGSFVADVVADRAGGLIVVGGNVNAPGSLYVRRYLPDGSRDPGYGTSGETTVPRAERSLAAATLTPDGGLLLSVAVDGYPTLARLSADGRLDQSFAGHGTSPIELAEPSWRQSVRRIFTGPSPVVLADGRIRVPVAIDMPEEEETRIAVVGLSADGHPELGFGFRGLALGPRPTLAARELPDEAIADATGSVIVAAALQGGDDDGLSDHSALIHRFRPDGSVDRSFGPGGVVQTAFQGGGYIGIDQSLALLGDETLVAGEYSFDGRYGGWGSPALRTINAGHDREDPSISIAVRSCRAALVKIEDASGTEAVVRVNGRVVRRTVRTRFRVRAPRGRTSVSVRATDLAENSSRARVRLPRC